MKFRRLPAPIAACLCIAPATRTQESSRAATVKRQGQFFYRPFCRLLLSFVCFVTLSVHGYSENALDRAYLENALNQIHQRDRLDALKAMNAKLDGIIIPDLKIENATLEEAVEKLRKAGMQNDKAEKDVDARGVNVHLDEKVKPTSQRINLEFKSQSLKSCVQALAQQAGLKVSVEAFSVRLLPPE